MQPPTSSTVRIPGLDRPYRWLEGWGDLPAPADPLAWAHPGLCVVDGDVVVVDPDRPVAHVLDAGGRAGASIALPVSEGHGLAPDPDEPGVLWVADPGFKLRARGAERVVEGPGHGRVLRLDRSGTVLLEIGAPPHRAYRDQAFKPTGMAFSGPAGDRVLWVADGYGANLVHRFRVDGTWLGAIAGGRDGDLPFQTPHAVFIDTRSADPDVLVTDRIGRRLQACDLDGRFRRTVADGELTSPSALALLGDLLVVGELRGSLAVLDPDGAVVGRVGDRGAEASEPDWPNARDEVGDLVRSPRILPGGFRAPHGLAITPDGAIVVAEFVLGGRLVRLEPA